MNKIIIFFILSIFIAGCSLNKNSKFWTTSENIPKENSKDYKEVLLEETALGQELNPDLIIKLDGGISNNLSERNYFNNWS